MTRFKTLLCALAVVLAASMGGSAMAAPGDSAVGDWHGVLETPRGNLTIVITVKKDNAGALTADLESVNQAPGLKIPMSSFSVTDSHMSFAISRIQASYEGDWDAAGQQWKGTFHQGADLPLTLSKGPPASKPVIEGLDGRWEGTIDRNGKKLRLVLRIKTGSYGTIVVLDSPDQLARGIPVKDVSRDGSTVRLHLSQGSQGYEGQLSADGKTITGTWTSAIGEKLPLTFSHTSDTAARKTPERPQTPKPPFDYKVVEVGFDNPFEKGVSLAGTLTLPKGKGPFPAAILITGSGAQDRDETILGHKPFAVIADHLTKHGIAVLRYDDRGVGGSKGDYAAATSADLATDANSAARYLMTRPEIRHDAIGFIGHSEGGMIGPIAMASNKNIAFLVMLAGPGTRSDKLLLSQRRLLLTAQGVPEKTLDRAEPVLASVFKAIEGGDTPEAGVDAARALLTPDAMAALGAPPGTDKNLVLKQLSGPWMRYFLRYDPAPNLRKIHVPVLAMGGSLDRQVPADENLPAIKAALVNSPDVTIKEIPGLNHLFQTAKTGAVGEYADIQQTFAPVALDIMTNWLTKRFVKN